LPSVREESQMRFHRSLHADGWHIRLPLRRAHPHRPLDLHGAAADTAPARSNRGVQILAVFTAVGALLASAGLNIAGDPRPLDMQLSGAMRQAGDMLNRWQDTLSRGWQVSLRAVADGRDTQPKQPAEASLFAQAEPGVADADHQHPVRAELAPRQLQPTR
jgi:hypothetical protein